MVKQFFLLGIRFAYSNSAGIRMVSLGKHLVFINPIAPRWLLKALAFIRGFFPVFYDVGTFCCDTHNVRWRLAWAPMERLFDYDGWESA